MYIQLVFEAVVVVVVVVAVAVAVAVVVVAAVVVVVVLMLFLLQYILKKENEIVWHSEGVYICIYVYMYMKL